MRTCESHDEAIVVYLGRDCPACVAEGNWSSANDKIAELEDNYADMKEDRDHQRDLYDEAQVTIEKLTDQIDDLEKQVSA